MRVSRLFLMMAASTTFAGTALAQNASSQQPSIEMNREVLRSLRNSAAATTGESERAAPRAYENVYEPITIDGEGRTTTITPGRPRLVWVKGPDGQQVAMKPDKPRKKRKKKPAAANQESKQCPCPTEAAKAAPVTPVQEEPKKEEAKVPEPAAPKAAPVVPAPPAPAPAPTPAPAPVEPTKPAEPAPAAPAAATPPALPTPPAEPVPVAQPATPPAPPATAPATAPNPAAEPAKPAAPAAPAAPGTTPTEGGKADLSIGFKATETALPLTTKEQMDALVAKLKADEALRVNLVAYAAATPDQANTARRVSLSRALSVRAYLIDNGIGNLRINVQAEGDKNPGGEADRVDVFVTK